MATVTVEVPDELANNYPDESSLQRILLEDFVIEQRQRGVISLGRAAEILNITYVEFFGLLGEKGLSFVNASTEETEASYRNYRRLMEQHRR